VHGRTASLQAASITLLSNRRIFKGESMSVSGSNDAFMNNQYFGIHHVLTENSTVLGIFAAALQNEIRRQSYTDKVE